MIDDGEHYRLPILPALMREKLNKLPSDKSLWPAEFLQAYKKLRSDFTSAKGEYIKWMRSDRDSRMNKTAKFILSFIVDCVNFDTGRCDPSHQTIADELNIGLRTVERTIPKIEKSGWLKVGRRGRTSTNFYLLAVEKKKVNAILDFSTSLRDQRHDARKRRLAIFSDPSKVAGHFVPEPSIVAAHEPSKVAGRDPPLLGGKHMNRTFEDEHMNKGSCSESREDTYPREDIPTQEVLFNAWIARNIPDRSKHREAFRLLRERKMTPEVLRRMAA